MAADDAVAAAPVAASDADPTAPLSPIEMWRQIEQDLDSKTTLPVETRDCWLYGMYKELPGGARFEIEMRYCSIGWSVPASFGDAKGLEPDRRLVSVMIRHGQGGFDGHVARTATPGEPPSSCIVSMASMMIPLMTWRHLTLRWLRVLKRRLAADESVL